MKLRTKIFFLTIPIGVIPLVVAAAITAYVVTDAHRDDVAKLEAAVLTQDAADVQNFVDEDILAQTTILVPYGPGVDVATSAQQFALSETLAARPLFESLSFIDLQGRETTRVDRAHPQGYPASELRDMSAAPEFLAITGGHYYVGPVSYTAEGPEITFGSPFKNSSGQTIGVVSGVANVGGLQNVVSSTKIGETGYLYLVDQTGALMAGGGPFADPAKIGAGATSTAAQPIVMNVLAGNNLLTPQTQERYANVFGQGVVAAGGFLDEYGSRWALVAEWPTAEADAVIMALLVRDIIILAIVLLAIILASLGAALFITRPIRKLTEATARVAKGDFQEGVAIATGDELEDLGNSFNGMVQGLKQLEALKDEFVFIAAHELKTPVAAIKGYLSLILDGATGGVNDGTRSYIEKVIASNQRLIQLVNDLLEVARSEAGRLTIKVAPIALPPAIRGTLDELKSLADEKSIKVMYEPAATLPNVLADADRVKEVMVNLVGNAIKYMGGAGTITITHEIRESKDGKGRQVMTSVADTGLGMSPGAQAKLFEKFYRVQTDKTKDIQGTGLGLFIVKEIVEKMNGMITVVSEEGKGSTFSFSLPAAG